MRIQHHNLYFCNERADLDERPRALSIAAQQIDDGVSDLTMFRVVIHLGERHREVIMTSTGG